MMQKKSVTVIGLGPMGRAMVTTFLDSGHPVTVWNRTRSRADDLVAKGAVLADDPAGAVAAGEIVVLSLTDYDAMYAVLGPATGALAGKTLVNLSSDTPDKGLDVGGLDVAQALHVRVLDAGLDGRGVPAPDD
ncbi:NAD(P)-binding domain-containing protein, partial [Streptomyces cyaneofuscatus]